MQNMPLVSYYLGQKGHCCCLLLSFGPIVRYIINPLDGSMMSHGERLCHEMAVYKNICSPAIVFMQYATIQCYMVPLLRDHPSMETILNFDRSLKRASLIILEYCLQLQKSCFGLELVSKCLWWIQISINRDTTPESPTLGCWSRRVLWIFCSVEFFYQSFSL